MNTKTSAGYGLTPDRPIVTIETRKQWRQWLKSEHDRSGGVLVVTTKPGRIDDDHSALLCTPRKPGSGWSRVNKIRINALLEEGLIAAPGQKVIDAAKVDGSWQALDAVDALEIPDDLRRALAKHGNAAANFDAFPPSARRGILEWIVQAKTDPTRNKRINETAQLAKDNIRANQWPR